MGYILFHTGLLNTNNSTIIDLKTGKEYELSNRSKELVEKGIIKDGEERYYFKTDDLIWRNGYNCPWRDDAYYKEWRLLNPEDKRCEIMCPHCSKYNYNGGDDYDHYPEVKIRKGLLNLNTYIIHDMEDGSEYNFSSADEQMIDNNAIKDGDEIKFVKCIDLNTPEELEERLKFNPTYLSLMYVLILCPLCGKYG